MSHEVETMAYAGQVPWHGIGTKVAADLTPRQILKRSISSTSSVLLVIWKCTLLVH